jgi:ribosome biogenesis ATPase
LGNLLQAAAPACRERAYLSLRTGDGVAAEGGQPGGAAAAADPVITAEDWEKALTEVKPSVRDAEKYVLDGQ